MAEAKQKQTKIVQEVDSNKFGAGRCQYCGSNHTYLMTRVVGYFSQTDNWNKSKLMELKKRQQARKYYMKGLKKSE